MATLAGRSFPGPLNLRTVLTFKLFILWLLLCVVAFGQPADTIFRNGVIWTGDESGSRATALAVRDGRIIYVGDQSPSMELFGPNTEVIELAGKMVVPGFCDTHVHPVAGGVELGQLQLAEAKTKADVASSLRAYALEFSELPWLVGGGWSPVDLPPDIDRLDLDAAESERPVFLTSADAHTAWVNSRALEEAGIDAATPEPEGGRIERDAQGRPNGLLREEAVSMIARLLPEIAPQDLLGGAERGLALAASFGITTLHDANATPSILRTYQSLEASGRLKARIVAALWTDPRAGADQVERLKSLRDDFRSPLLSPTAAKIFADGVLESRTAAVLEPYEGFPGERGLLQWESSALKEAVTAFDRAGFQVHIHAIGDRAVREGLDAYQAAREANGSRDSRHQIAHLELIDPRDIPRFAELDVIANIQPLWAFRDIYIVEGTEPLLGPRRSAALYPLGSLSRAGARLAGGSDWNVSSMNPLEAIQVAITRRDPEHPLGESWLPEQRLSVEEALRAYTTGGAFASFSEDQTGTLEVGKWADFVVLDRDLFNIPVTEIGQVKVLQTVLGGETVYRAPVQDK